MPQPNHDLLYKIGLTLLPKIGPINSKRLLAYMGSAEAVFNDPKSTLLKVPGIGEILVKSILDERTEALKRAEKELLFIEKYAIDVLFYLDKQYPEKLTHCEDGPLLLYKKGNGNFNSSKILAVVGTRNATKYGKEYCEKIISDLAHHSDLLILSGLASGIDVCAHKAALENNIPTSGVLGHGLDRIYPPSHRETSLKMLTSGCLITEFMSETNPDRENFPKRNRIVAGICDALLVIESDIKGGSMITAKLASAYNRDVFALPGHVDHQYSKGCNYLIKTNQASLIVDARDIEHIMGWNSPKNKTKGNQTALFVDLSDEEQKIVDLLKEKGDLKVDQISLFLELKMSDVLAYLLNLEMNMMVRALPGKIYSLAV